MTSSKSNSNNDSFSTDEGVEIRSRHVDEGDVLAMTITQTDAHSNGNVSNNTKGGLGNTALKVLGGTAVLAAVGSASYGAGVNSTVAKMNTVVTSQKASAGKSEKSKAGKKVCLEYGFVNDEVIKGQFPSDDPLEGQTGGLTGVCSTDFALCVAASGNPESKGCKDYPKCLVDAGAVVGPWWLNRDVSNGEAYFTDDALCGRITATALNSRTRFELWDENVNEPLSRYREFKVDYEIISTGGNDGYVNLYVRVKAASTQYYDCNFVFSTSGTVGSGQILINLDTQSNSARPRSGADSTGCVNGYSLQDYIDANALNSNAAVMGVGNGETYTHVLNTGSTNDNNSGSNVCWKDAVFTRVDENGVQVIDQYEFTLN